MRIRSIFFYCPLSSCFNINHFKDHHMQNRYINSFQRFKKSNRIKSDTGQRISYYTQEEEKFSIFPQNERRRKCIVDTNYSELLSIFKSRLLLYIDRHIIVVNKPCGLLSQGDLSKSNDLLTLTKKYIQREKNIHNKEIYLGLVHRLDRNVSGCMVFARNSKAARRLCEQLASRTNEKMVGKDGKAILAKNELQKLKIIDAVPKFEKVYYCIVHGSIEAHTTTFISALLFSKNKKIDKHIPHQSKFNKTYIQDLKCVQYEKNGNVKHEYRDSANIGDITSDKSGDLREATLSFKSLACFKHKIKYDGNKHAKNLKYEKEECQTLLRIELTTGRKHQIRAMLKEIGHPIIGDIKYGSKTKFRDNSIALHAGVLGFVYPSFQASTKLSETLPDVESHCVAPTTLDYKTSKCFFNASICGMERTNISIANRLENIKGETTSFQRLSNFTRKLKKKFYVSFGCLPPSSWLQRYGEDIMLSIESDIRSSIAKMSKNPN